MTAPGEAHETPGEAHHGHAHEGGTGAPHDPAPPEPRFQLPSAESAVRGLALAGLAAGAGWAAISAVRATLALVPVSALLGAVSLLAAWAAAIHLTGGEKFDDHPFV